MKKLKGNIFIENRFSGVTVGALLLSEGTVLVDAPLKPEDGRAWLVALSDVGAHPRRILVNLDSHPDRSLGAQTLDSQVVTHEKTAEHFRNRAAIFKAVRQESGADWEKLEGLGGLRWAMPSLVFSDVAQLHFGDRELRLESRPGASPGASWLVVPESKTLFVGDAVTPKQPPFLALSDIPAWVESLDVLLSKEYKDYRIISGRGGVVKLEDVRTQRRFLKDVEGRLERLSKRKANVSELDKLIPKLMVKYKYPAKFRAAHSQRLSYGLKNYFQAQY
jgi:glyoxylase-like metal-dependent hydrolase (beta-lactamase superfamily II)